METLVVKRYIPKKTAKKDHQKRHMKRLPEKITEKTTRPTLLIVVYTGQAVYRAVYLV
jgi:demethoxyubiquinone hydroxylase (CLK1/Coq7/Cat5 family)